MNKAHKYLLTSLLALYLSAFAAVKSTITPLTFCYSGEIVTFKYDFSNAPADSAKFLIYSKKLKIDIPILFIKDKIETEKLQDIGEYITIKYTDNNINRKKEINLTNFQCNGKKPSKHDDDIEK